LVPTVRLGTNLQHTLGAHRSVARSQLVKETDLDFLQVRFCWAGMCERHAPGTSFSRDAGAIGVQDALEALDDQKDG